MDVLVAVAPPLRKAGQKTRTQWVLKVPMDARDAQYHRDAQEAARPPDEHETRDPRDAPETTVLVPGIVIVLMPSIYYYISPSSKKQKGGHPSADGPRPYNTRSAVRGRRYSGTANRKSAIDNRQ